MNFITGFFNLHEPDGTILRANRVQLETTMEAFSLALYSLLQKENQPVREAYQQRTILKKDPSDAREGLLPNFVHTVLSCENNGTVRFLRVGTQTACGAVCRPVVEYEQQLLVIILTLH